MGGGGVISTMTYGVAKYIGMWGTEGVKWVTVSQGMYISGLTGDHAREAAMCAAFREMQCETRGTVQDVRRGAGHGTQDAGSDKARRKESRSPDGGVAFRVSRG
jgi:hypothetical protein